MRKWVKKRIGEEHLIPLLGVWDSFDGIDFDKLPNQFVLKANHGSTWNIIVKDKAQLNIAEAKQKFDGWMARNYAYNPGQELHYMNIPPKILAEKYMGELNDYKLMCFSGEVKFLWVDTDRYTDHRRTLFAPQWERMEEEIGYPKADKMIPPPPHHWKPCWRAHGFSRRTLRTFG